MQRARTVMLLRLLLGAALLCAAITAMCATVFTSRPAWEAAVGGPVTVDPFATDIAGQFAFTFDSGVLSAATGGSEDIALNAVVGGAYFGGVDIDGSDGFDQILWTFPHLILGFAADWSSTGENGGVLGIAGDFDGGGEIVFRPVDTLGGVGTGFFGIVGSVPIASVRLILSPVIAGTTNNESFFADNLSFPSASASVPEPASLALIGLGFAGLAASRRRKLN